MEGFCRRVSIDEPGSVEAAGAGTLRTKLDPIPDFIPGVGLLDEMVVVPIGVLIAAKMIPREVMQECQESAREVSEGEKPVSRMAAVIVVAVWLLCVALAVLLAVGVFLLPRARLFSTCVERGKL